MESEIGKQVRIILKNDFHYTGIILDSDDLSILLKDKFGKQVRLSRDSIMILEDNGK